MDFSAGVLPDIYRTSKVLCFSENENSFLQSAALLATVECLAFRHDSEFFGIGGTCVPAVAAVLVHTMLTPLSWRERGIFCEGNVLFSGMSPITNSRLLPQKASIAAVYLDDSGRSVLQIIDAETRRTTATALKQVISSAQCRDILYFPSLYSVLLMFPFNQPWLLIELGESGAETPCTVAAYDNNILVEQGITKSFSNLRWCPVCASAWGQPCVEAVLAKQNALPKGTTVEHFVVCGTNSALAVFQVTSNSRSTSIEPYGKFTVLPKELVGPVGLVPVDHLGPGFLLLSTYSTLSLIHFDPIAGIVTLDKILFNHSSITGHITLAPKQLYPPSVALQQNAQNHAKSSNSEGCQTVFAVALTKSILFIDIATGYSKLLFFPDIVGDCNSFLLLPELLVMSETIMPGLVFVRLRQLWSHIPWFEGPIHCSPPHWIERTTMVIAQAPS